MVVEIRSLKHDIERLSQTSFDEISALHQQLSVKEADAERLNLEIHHLRLELQAASGLSHEQNLRSTETINELNSSLSRAKLEIERLRKTLDEKVMLIQTMAADHQKTSQRLGETQREVESKLQEITQLRNLVAMLNGNLQASNEQISVLKQQVLLHTGADLAADHQVAPQSVRQTEETQIRELADG